MTPGQESIYRLLDTLEERAKELNCLYAVEEVLRRESATTADLCKGIVEVVPGGWQYPEICRARIQLHGESYESSGFAESPWHLEAHIRVNDQQVGNLQVHYTSLAPQADDGPFLKEEAKLIASIASRLGHALTYRQLRQHSHEVQEARLAVEKHTKAEWRVVLDLLRQTDRDLHSRLALKMLTHLCLGGNAEAQRLRRTSQPDLSEEDSALSYDSNRPHQAAERVAIADATEAIFRIANESMKDEAILAHLQQWIQEDKLSFLSLVVNRQVPLPVVIDAIRRYHLLIPSEAEGPSPTRRGVEVALIRRFLSEQPEYLNCAKQFISLGNFYELLEHLIYSNESHGKLGGKSAGLYLAASILRKSAGSEKLLAQVMVPKTWHLTSDLILHFMHFNDLDDITEQKYKDTEQVRQEYPHIVQLFKRSLFPPDIIKGLSVALDDLGDCPVIVRSSSLLEDRTGAAFSGKYKSLFLANQGTKAERLKALTDAIAEVYASTFGPDPIEYRTERGLLDFGEEMGVMIQEVVGRRAGKYFLPAFAGVAFSRNEFRWSPRIEREDGLLRIVPGLGTRAVDRLSDDYPVLIAPGQPRLRVNRTVDEILRYAPKYMDVINLESNTFETIPIADFIESCSAGMPALGNIVSVCDESGMLRKARMGFFDVGPQDYVTTFDGLVEDTPFIDQVRKILTVLESTLGTPVDIEFASNGTDFYLLQCRAQSASREFTASPIPKDVRPDRIVFTANRYVSNGSLTDITHIVYVDPMSYGELPDRASLVDVGRAVSKLNELLPKRRFILMGPGRWGSRGDIRLGVGVTYSDINNTAALIEIARQTGNYLPEVSFGTHFFQDLVEARIIYLPLYPDDGGTVFNDTFLTGSPNLFAEVLPGYSHLADTIRLIDIPKSTDGLTLQLLMNADLNEAIALLTKPGGTFQGITTRKREGWDAPSGKLLALASADGRADRRRDAAGGIRGGGHVCLRKHEECDGRSRQ